jgi:hypothetical protein
VTTRAEETALAASDQEDRMRARGEHRESAELALGGAQRNPVMSAGESFLAAQVHALLAIELRLGEIVEALRQRSSLADAGEPVPVVRLV